MARRLAGLEGDLESLIVDVTSIEHADKEWEIIVSI